eukprot:GEMP01029049.1.p1 GENE.GEMP01029049.1~~GEMP01029049.1.p1  ORF type:complete len:234 (+),score=50.06 GEMP01029049.1:63-764(+)
MATGSRSPRNTDNVARERGVSGYNPTVRKGDANAMSCDTVLENNARESARENASPLYFCYRHREPSLSVLFPKAPGEWKLDDLNLHSLGLSVKSKEEVLQVMTTTVLTVIFGNNVLCPQKDAIATVEYIAWYTNKKDHGVMWDSTYQRGVPLKFKVGSDAVFAGLDYAVSQMGIGEKAIAYVPWAEAFGKKGFIAKVPPESHLILWLCLTSVTQPVKKPVRKKMFLKSLTACP